VTPPADVLDDHRGRALQDWVRQGAKWWRERLGYWFSPRLPTLRHHPPQPLEVPRTYLRSPRFREWPRVSIVTPSYNQGRFLARAIESVLMQGYPRLEHIVQDGGSTEETVRTLGRYRSSLARCESAPDSGQAQALNRGFARSTGEVMSYLNADDFLLPGAVAYVARYFASHPAVDVVYGHRILVDAEDRQIGIWAVPRHDDDALSWLDDIPQETLFWRRGAWERTGGRMDESFQFAIDWDLLLRFREVGAKMVRLPRFLGAFRVHPEQKTATQQHVCDEESARLWARVHGRALTPEEAQEAATRYRRRHIPYHTLYRAIARLPLPRVGVTVRPRSHLRA
jgi:hypothetical protein